ncbi:MAG: hypothetical protein ABIL01_25975 [Pseudomonadota bacterium]
MKAKKQALQKKSRGARATTRSPTARTGNSAPPCFQDAGWFQWPENEEYSLEFMRVLASAQEGASTISECFFTARLITPGDDESWYDAWKKVAKTNNARGDEAFEQGGLNAATSNWLRASNYYRTAGAFLQSRDPRRKLLIQTIRACSRRYLEHIRPKGEVLQIPFEGKHELEGYFIRAPSTQSLLPVVICLGGMDVGKDDLLYTMPRNATGNGLSLLMVDLPDFEAVADGENASTVIDVEVPISRWVDYLLARGDIDPSRIAIYGDGLGASYATRAATHDRRFAAAICDGGLWARKERLFVMSRMADSRDEGTIDESAWMIGDMVLGTRAIKCPHLIMIGQHDYIAVETAKETYELNKRMGMRPSLKVFSTEETGASPGQMDNPTLAKEFVFEWIRKQLKMG